MAAPTTIRQLIVALGVKADDATVKRFDGALKAAKKTMIATAAAATALGVALFASAKSTATYGDEVAKASKRTGLAAQSYQELEFAAERSGASIKDVEKGFRRMGAAADDASQGLLAQKRAFDLLGVSVTDESGNLKEQNALFSELADAMNAVENQTLQLALGQDIFGRGFAKMRPLLAEGSEGIAKLREEANKLGFIMGGEALAASELFVDRLFDLKQIVLGVRNTIGSELVPVFSDMLRAMRDWFVANQAVIKQGLTAFARRTVKALRSLGRALKLIDERMRKAGGWIRVTKALTKVLLALGLSVGVIALSAAAFGGFTTALTGYALAAWNAVAATLALIAPYVAVAAFIAVVLLALDDLWISLNGGDGLIARFFDRFGEGEEPLDKVARALKVIGELVTIDDDVIDFWTQFGDAVKDVATWLGELVTIDDDVIQFWAGVVGKVGSALGGATIDPVLAGVADFAGRGASAVGERVTASAERALGTVTNTNVAGSTIQITGSNVDPAETVRRLEAQRLQGALSTAQAGAEL